MQRFRARQRTDQHLGRLGDAGGRAVRRAFDFFQLGVPRRHEVEAVHGKAGLGEVRRHRRTHDAKADDADVFHKTNPPLAAVINAGSLPPSTGGRRKRTLIYFSSSLFWRAFSLWKTKAARSPAPR